MKRNVEEDTQTQLRSDAYLVVYKASKLLSRRGMEKASNIEDLRIAIDQFLENRLKEYICPPSIS